MENAALSGVDASAEVWDATRPELGRSPLQYHSLQVSLMAPSTIALSLSNLKLTAKAKAHAREEVLLCCVHTATRDGDTRV